MSRRPIILCAALVLALALPRPAAADPIGSLHCNDAEGAPRLKGQTVTIAGVVTGQFSTERNVRLYVQDATGAIDVYGTPKNCAVAGDSVRVTGVVAAYGGLTEISGTAEKPVEIVSLGRAASVPAPLPLSLAEVLATEQPDGCEPNESRLVVIDGVRLLAASGARLPDGAKFGDDTNYRLVAGSDTTVFVTLRVTDPEGCDLSRTLEGQPIPAAGPLQVVGILSQYTGRGQSHGGYQILPRGRDDVRLLTSSVAAPAKR